MRTLALAIAFGATLFLFAATATRAASLHVEGQAAASANQVGGAFPFDETAATGPVSGFEELKVDTCCGFVRGQASAEADYGILRADSNATASGLNDPGGGAFVATAYARAQWTDTLTIPGPISFSASSMTVNITVGGSLSASDGGGLLAGAIAYYEVTVGSGLCGASCLEKSGEIRSTSLGGSVLIGDAPGAFIVMIPFQFNVPFDVTVRIGTGVQADGGLEPGITSDAYSSFGNTVTWDGISEVRDPLGVVVPTFTVTSTSGVDYAQPVPEPLISGTIAALVTLAGLRRRPD